MSVLNRIVILATLLPSACAVSPAPTLLALERPMYSGPSTSVKAPLIIGPVSIPEAVDRVEIVRLLDNLRLETVPTTRWAQPLRSQVSEALAANLAQALDNPRIQPAGLSQPAGSHQRLSVDLLRLDLHGSDKLQVEALWVLGAAGKELASQRISFSEKLNGTGGAEIAAAHSRAVARLATEIAAVIRALPP